MLILEGSWRDGSRRLESGELEFHTQQDVVQEMVSNSSEIWPKKNVMEIRRLYLLRFRLRRSHCTGAHLGRGIGSNA